LASLTTVTQQVRIVGTPQNKQWKAVADLQWKTAGDLRDLARALRTPADKLAALREARQRIDKAIGQQEALRQQAEKDPEKPDGEKKPAPPVVDPRRQPGRLAPQRHERPERREAGGPGPARTQE